ncbi:MAG: alkaline phosphatase family protein, partial [Thermoflexales bacterium]
MKVMLVGWDGAEPSLVGELIAGGQMPNLARLTRGGLLTEIASTIRPESAVAWATLLTASPPAAHGVFGFAYHAPGSYRTRLYTTAGQHQPFLWERLSAAGLTSVAINPPMTYPPRPLRGALVCGQMTPSAEHIFTYPADLSARLRAMGYPLDAEPPEPDEDREAYLARMEAQVARRTEIALDLLREQRWDFALVAYTELDRLQHFFWADMDAQHPAHARRQPTGRTTDGIARHYRALDAALGALLDVAHPDLAIIVSDHGFGPCSRKVHMNVWLRRLGLFIPKLSGAALGVGALSELRRLRRWAPARALKRRLLGQRPLVGHDLQTTAFEQGVEWQRTRAWFSEAGGIRINLAGREPQGVVRPGQEYEALRATLIDAALSLRDPLSGLPIFARAEPRESLYPGSPHLEAAPDIILETFHPRAHALQNHIPLSGHAASPDAAICADAFPYTATHTDRALLAANRPPDMPVADLAGVGRWALGAFGL